MLVERFDFRLSTFPFESLAHDSRWMHLGMCRIRLSENLTELTDNRRLLRHLPNDLPARFLV
jgi:phage protein U